MIRKDLRKNRNYSKAMNAARNVMVRYKNAHPFCEVCGRNAEEVHHIMPVESEHDLNKMIKLATEWSNMKAMCKSCHIQAHVDLRSKNKETIQAKREERMNHILQSFGVDTKAGYGF